jgi:sugar phosphate isomerase/epimerase
MRIGFIARPVEDDFEFAALKDIPCVEFVLHGELAETRHAHEVRSWSHKYEVAISNVGLYGVNYISEDAAEREAGIASLRKAVDFARAVGSPLITTGGGLNPALSAEESGRRTLDVLGPETERVRASGLRFAFYNCHWTNWITGPAAWGTVLEALPHAGIKFDPTHPLYAGEDWAAHLAEWGSRVYHTHAKDTLVIGGKPFEDVPAGLGDIHWGRFFALLYHHGYRGDVCIEPHSATWQGGRLYGGILLARRHLEQFIAPPATATLRDLAARTG